MDQANINRRNLTVCDLQTGRLQLCDTQRLLEMGVEDICSRLSATSRTARASNSPRRPYAKPHKKKSDVTRMKAHKKGLVMKPVRRGLPPLPPETTAPPAMIESDERVRVEEERDGRWSRVKMTCSSG